MVRVFTGSHDCVLIHLPEYQKKVMVLQRGGRGPGILQIPFNTQGCIPLCPERMAPKSVSLKPLAAYRYVPVCKMTVFLILSFQGSDLEPQTQLSDTMMSTQHWPAERALHSQ